MDRYRVLETLRARRGEWMAVAELAARLSADAREVRRAVGTLRRLGYLIETDPALGLRLTGAEDRLLAYEIGRDLGARIIGREVISRARVVSTNDIAWKRAEDKSSEGLVVFAESQTRGRGRLGRRWISPARSGLLFSVVLKPPDLSPNRTAALTAVAAVAVVEALQESLHLPALIRWPNDILLRGRKLGGILVEARRHGSSATFVLGIGLNVNLDHKDMPAPLRNIATSLSSHLGRAVNRVELARALLRALDRWYEELRNGRDASINSHWRQYSATLGGRITLVENGRRWTGRVLDLSLKEGLILRLDRGGARVFDGALVSVVNEPEAEGSE